LVIWPSRPAIPAGVFQRHQSEIARHLLSALKAARIADDQYEAQCGERTDTGMRHQTPGCGALLDFPLNRLAQFRDGWVQSIQQLQQVAPSPACPWSQLE
jgi:hypothetical protein